MLEVVLSYINGRIAALNTFADIKGLAEIIKDEGGGVSTSFPAIYCAGEYKDVSDFDIKKGVIYHRKTGAVSVSSSDEQAISGCDTFQTYTFPMRVVAVVKRNVLTKKNDDAFIDDKLTHNLRSAITTTNNAALNTSLKADNVSINITSILTDRYTIHDQEYSGMDMKIGFEYAYLAIDYEITISGSAECFENFDCESTSIPLFCDPVTILDEEGNTLATVASGGTYTVADCPVCPPGLDINPWQATGMLFYAEASRETAYADNDLVGSITDMTANANHATAAGTNRATYKTNVLNSLASYRFLGDDLHVTGNITCRYPILFVVFRTSTNAMIAELAFTGATLHLAFITDKNVFVGNMLNHSKAAAGGGDASRFPTNASDMSDNINRNVRIQTNSNFQGLEIWYNNVLQTPFTDSVTGTPGTADITGNFSIGARNTGTIFMTGDIYAIGLADAHFMSGIDVQRISRYLANRFAITDNLP